MITAIHWIPGPRGYRPEALANAVVGIGGRLLTRPRALDRYGRIWCEGFSRSDARGNQIVLVLAPIRPERPPRA